MFPKDFSIRHFPGVEESPRKRRQALHAAAIWCSTRRPPITGRGGTSWAWEDSVLLHVLLELSLRSCFLPEHEAKEQCHEGEYCKEHESSYVLLATIVP